MSSAKILNYGVELYQVSVKDGGTMDFRFVDDAGLVTNNGTLTIRGNLDVQGTTTTVGSSDLVVTDNTITVNDGNTGYGVSAALNYQAGIIVDRGLWSNAEMFWDESLDSYRNGSIANPATGVGGAFSFGLNSGEYNGIYVSSINAGEGNDLNLLPGQTLGLVTVTGTNEYEKQIFPYTGSNISYNGVNANRLATPNEPDALVNTQLLIDYVRDYHTYNWQDAIKAPVPDGGNTRVQVYDTEGGDPTSKAEVVIDSVTAIEAFASYTNINDVRITGSTLSTININGDLTVQANGTGSVVFPDPLNFTKDTDPTAPSDGVKLYGKAVGDGGTGLFFINEDGTNDEIISRNKALLYSIIF